MLKLAAAILVVILLALVAIRWQGGQYRQFMAGAEKRQAVLIAKREVVTDQKNQRREFQVEYHYTDAGGRQHIAVEKLEYPDIFARLEEGREVAVYVSRAAPEKSYLAEALERRLRIGKAAGVR